MCVCIYVCMYVCMYVSYTKVLEMCVGGIQFLAGLILGVYTALLLCVPKQVCVANVLLTCC